MGCGRSSESSASATARVGKQALVVYNYTAEANNQHSLAKGETIEVMGAPNENGWVECRKNGKLGWVPTGFFEIIATDISVTVRPAADSEVDQKVPLMEKDDPILSVKWECQWEGIIVNEDKSDWRMSLMISETDERLLLEVTSLSKEMRASLMMDKEEISKVGLMEASKIQVMRMDQIVQSLIKLCQSGKIGILEPTLPESSVVGEGKPLTLVVSNPINDQKFSLDLNTQRWDYRDIKVSWLEQQITLRDQTIDTLSQQMRHLQGSQ